MQTNTRNYWPWFFFAAAFESLLFVGILFSIPSESGLSFARSLLLSILLLAFVVSVTRGLRSRHSTASLDALPRNILILFGSLLSLTSGLALFLLRYLNPERLLPVYERLSPVLWYFLLFGIQSAFFILFLRNGLHRNEFLKRKYIYRSAGIALIILLALLVFVASTKAGVTPDPAYWGEPGVAILGWHFGLSILFGFGILLCGMRFVFFDKSQFPNYLLPFLIWVLASILWLSVPWEVLRSSFYAPITPPGNTPFPYSDAGFYDYLAQSLLIGADYLHAIPPRPLYVLFLAGLHALFGQDYIAIIAAQTLVLALFPVALYFLAKKLHTPAAGVTVALFAIFREYLGLLISSNTRVANSKMFTTDFPTALGIAVVCLVMTWWLEKRDLKSTLVAGGAFGLLLLLRTQSLLILPVAFILAWFIYERRAKYWLIAGIVFGSAMALTITPWLIHNYTVTGQFTFDDPRQMAIIYSQYSFSDNLDLSQFDSQNESLGNRLVNFALANPVYVAGFVTNHFINTQIGGLLALPLIERYDGLFAPVNLYWIEWSGTLTWYNLLLVLIYLAILAVGLGAAWHRMHWIGLTPLAFNLGYALANGISRFSSWRYNLPVDWVIYFYFAIGAIEILGGLALLFGIKVEKIFPAVIDRAGTFNFSLKQLRPKLALILAAFIFVGAMPWLAEGVVSPRYTASEGQLASALVDKGYPASEIEGFLSQPNAIILEGRLLYPRMYRRGQGMSSAHPWRAYEAQDFARIGFIFINDNRRDVIFITREPLDFPQGADTIMLGCQRDGYIEARLVDFDDATFTSAPLTDSCE
jgi:hypothetical protein